MSVESQALTGHMIAARDPLNGEATLGIGAWFAYFLQHLFACLVVCVVLSLVSSASTSTMSSILFTGLAIVPDFIARNAGSMATCLTKNPLIILGVIYLTGLTARISALLEIRLLLLPTLQKQVVVSLNRFLVSQTSNTTGVKISGAVGTFEVSNSICLYLYGN